MNHLNELWLRSLIRFRTAARDERGASLIEYALLVALIALVCVVAVTSLGQAPKEIFESTATEL